MNKNVIYCVHCREKVAVQAVSTVFRTGYYRVSTRIGICVDCEDGLSSKKAICEMAAGASVMEQPALPS